MHPAEDQYQYQGQGQGQCRPCPEGATCAEEGTTLATIDVKAGWYRFGPLSNNLYECVDEGGCIGGRNASKGLCAEGHEGALWYGWVSTKTFQLN